MYLERIKSPADLKKLSVRELKDVADEVRDTVIRCISRNGGHLASNLGVIELTLALHYVFNSPVDKIIWDVGHQSYTHKLITGRYDRVNTMRSARDTALHLSPQPWELRKEETEKGKTSRSSP
jgi:1-deoxy-D-xylulose-5-phosphate synthase